MEFNSYRFGAGRYIQEEKVLEFAGPEIARYGSKAYVVTGYKSWDAVKDRITDSLNESIEWILEQYKGFPSYESADRIAKTMRDQKCDVLVGIGGGVISDLTKAAAKAAGVPIILIPTSAATCAAFSPLSVMYTDEGQCLGAYRFEYEVNSVLVDEQVLVKQPPRLLAAGIMDAMAKMIEISNGKPEITVETDTIDKFTAFSMAKFSYDVLEKYGRAAYLDVERKELTRDAHNIFFTAIAVTGVISAMMRGKGQTALAHQMYDSIRTVFFKECAAYLHGEIVATGLIMQLKYNSREDQIGQLKEFMTLMKMPMTIEELGLPCTEENLKVLYDKLNDDRFVEQTEEAAAALKEAMKEIIP